MDCKLLAKLSEGDMFATEALYHKSCLTDIYNKFKSSKRNESSESDILRKIEESALTDVVCYIKNTISVCYESELTPVFTQQSLTSLMVQLMNTHKKHIVPIYERKF